MLFFMRFFLFSLGWFKTCFISIPYGGNGYLFIQYPGEGVFMEI